MAKPSLHIGSNNWAIKDGKLLGYRETDKNKFVPREGDFERLGIGSYTDRNGILQTGIKTVEGGDLVNNGQFTDPVLGPELVTNGDFAINDNWTLSTGATIGGGVLTLNSGSSMSAKQVISLEAGKIYEISFEITAFTSGGVRVTIGNGFATNIESTVGVHTERIAVSDIGTSEVSVNTLGGANLSVDNVTVKETTSAWNFSDVSVDISGNLLNFTASDVGEQASQPLVLEAAKTFKIEYTISNYTSGGIQVYAGGQLLTERTAAGVYTEIIVSANSGGLFYIQASQNGTTASLSEIKVVELNEITDNFNKPRIDFSEDANGVLLLEPQAKNLVTYSEDFSNSSWSKISGGSGVNPILTSGQQSPKGDNSAYLVKFDLGGGVTSSDFSVLSTIVSATNGFTSVYMKGLIGGEEININTGSGLNQTFTLTNEWERYEIYNVSTSTFQIRLRGDLTNNNIVEILIWGAELKEDSSSYIPTNGSTVTRLQDEATQFGDVNTFNSEEGVIVLNISVLSEDSGNRAISISDGSINNVIDLRINNGNNIACKVVVGGVQQSFVSFLPQDTTSFNEYIFTWKQDDFKLYVNSSLEDSSNSGNIFPLNTLNQFRFDNGGGSAKFFGKTKYVKVYKSIADAQTEYPFIS